MSNMLSTGISGLKAAQVALNTVSNNISNTNTPGYSVQAVSQTEAVTQTNSNYTIGGGVNVVAVQRAYNSFLTSAVWSSNSGLQSATTTNNLASTLNSSLSASGDLQGSLDSFYGAFSSVANSPSSTSGRQALLGSASALTQVFNTLGQQLTQQQGQVNGQISSTVNSINSVLGNIASINQKIDQGSGAGQPNALLDQRDALVSTLSGYLGVTAVNESNGTVSVYSSSGQALVSGNHAYPLSTADSTYDPSTPDVYSSAGSDITQSISGGSLGALLNYRSQVLNPVQNQLGQAALALASSVNAQQAQGLDQNGKQGAPIFSVPAPTVLSAAGNLGAATVTASISQTSRLTASDYNLSFNGSQWNLQTTAGQSVLLTNNGNGSFSADGLSFSIAGGAPQAGDSYQIQPTRNGATGLAVSLTSPAGIAAAAALAVSKAGSNTGTARAGAVTVTDANNAALLSEAKVSFPTANSYQVTDASGNSLASGAYTSGAPITANGWSVSVSGTPVAGDSFNVAANSNGLNDNTNALSLAALASQGVLSGGSVSVLNAYASLTTQIGTVGNQAAINLTTQTNLNNQAVSSQQSVSGVNLDEEAAKLVNFQQAYQASAQIIAASQTIFSSLLAAVQR